MAVCEVGHGWESGWGAGRRFQRCCSCGWSWKGAVGAWLMGRGGFPPSSMGLGGVFALHAHCALLLDYVPPEEPPSTPLGNALRIR